MKKREKEDRERALRLATLVRTTYEAGVRQGFADPVCDVISVVNGNVSIWVEVWYPHTPKRLKFTVVKWVKGSMDDV